MMFCFFLLVFYVGDLVCSINSVFTQFESLASENQQVHANALTGLQLPNTNPEPLLSDAMSHVRQKLQENPTAVFETLNKNGYKVVSTERLDKQQKLLKELKKDWEALQQKSELAKKENKELEHLRGANDRLSSDIKKAHLTVTELQSQLEKLPSQMKEDFEAKDDQIKALKNELELKTQLLLTQEKKCEEYMKDYLTLSNNLAEALSESLTLKVLLGNEQKETQLAMQDCYQLEYTNKCLNDEISCYKDECAALKAQSLNKDVRFEGQGFKSNDGHPSLDDESKVNNEKITALKNQLAETEIEVTDLKGLLENEEQDNEANKQKLREQKEAFLKAKELSLEFERLKERVQSQGIELATVNSLLQKKNITQEKLGQALKSSQQMEAGLELLRAQQEIDTLNSQINQLNGEKSGFQTTITSLSQDLEKQKISFCSKMKGKLFAFFIAARAMNFVVIKAACVSAITKGHALLPKILPNIGRSWVFFRALFGR